MRKYICLVQDEETMKYRIVQTIAFNVEMARDFANKHGLCVAIRDDYPDKWAELGKLRDEYNKFN